MLISNVSSMREKKIWEYLKMWSPIKTKGGEKESEVSL